jgi:hypothetical protein
MVRVKAGNPDLHGLIERVFDMEVGRVSVDGPESHR